jgi:hypothetical protein
LPGFKIEAPQLAEAITAIAFQELIRNSPEGETNRDVEEKEADLGSSILQRLMTPLIKRAIDQMVTAMDKTK